MQENSGTYFHIVYCRSTMDIFEVLADSETLSYTLMLMFQFSMNYKHYLDDIEIIIFTKIEKKNIHIGCHIQWSFSDFQRSQTFDLVTEIHGATWT